MTKLTNSARMLKYRDEKRKRRNERRKKYYNNKNSNELIEKIYSKSDNAVRQRAHRNKLKSKKESTRQRQQKCRERQKESKHNEKCKSPLHSNVPIFKWRSTKMRAVNKFRTSLPKSPNKRICVLQTYLSNCKSPTAHALDRNCDITEKQMKLSTSVMKDIKTAINTCKNKRSKDSLTAMNVLVASVSGENVTKSKCIRRLSDELQLPIRRISGGKRIRTTILRSDKSCWTITKRQTRSDATSESVKQLCYQYWLSAGMSRPTGNKSDVKRERLGPKIYASHMIHVMEKSQTEIYQHFRIDNPDVKISQRQFEKYKPFYVRSVREKDRQTCCCRYHIEANLVFKSCKQFRQSCLNKMDRSAAGYLNANKFDRLSDVVNESLCSPTTLLCYNRSCNECGVENVHLLPEEIDKSDDAPKVKWQKYEYIDVNVKGKNTRKLLLIKQNTSPGEMFAYFCKLLQTFPAHSHRAVWQQTQFKSLMQHLPIGDCICVHDFSENYGCSDKQELQSTYFQRTEVTVHVTIIHRHAVLEIDGTESTPTNPSIVTEALFVISPDQRHDNHFVKQVQRLVADYLSTIPYSVSTMHEFTDGCACQYKSRHCFADLSTSSADLGYQRLIRNYYETSHAKGIVYYHKHV